MTHLSQGAFINAIKYLDPFQGKVSLPLRVYNSPMWGSSLKSWGWFYRVERRPNDDHAMDHMIHMTFQKRYL